MAESQAHYLRNVLRRQSGDRLRLFNGRDGEYLAVLQAVGKALVTARCETGLKVQPPAPVPLHLLFAPVKKARLDFLIEKAVELGATHLHPVITRNTETRTLNEDRLHAQIIEAAEQCERLDRPVLLPPMPLESLGQAWPAGCLVLACLERKNAPFIAQALSGVAGPRAALIGPEGGFTEEEALWLESLSFVRPVTLGARILRSETAACAALVQLSQGLPETVQSAGLPLK